jgi:hypothetical protein
LPTETKTSLWPATVDEILGGDQALAFAQVTPASGVVLTPLTNTSLRDTTEGMVTPVTSSIGASKKFQRLEKNPKVAFAYHTREHGFSDRPEYVLVQGRVSHSPYEDRSWIERNLANWERFSGPRNVGPVWERWLRYYHWRVAMEVAVERLIVWPDLTCDEEPTVYGAALPSGAAEPQSVPKKGTGPRINHRRAAKRIEGLPNRLLGWVGADGFPIVVPIDVVSVEKSGLVLEVREGVELPLGGRRAGLLGHSFARYTIGQNQRKHTGWLETMPGARRAFYAPHTDSGYYLPTSRFLYRLSAGFVTRRGFGEAQRAGLVSD